MLTHPIPLPKIADGRVYTLSNLAVCVLLGLVHPFIRMTVQISGLSRLMFIHR
jgi:hypothetical protein